MGAAIKVAGNARFEKVKPWGNKAKKTDGTEAALIDPEVYFNFTFCAIKIRKPFSMLYVLSGGDKGATG